MKKSLKALPILALAGLTLSAVVPASAQEGTINVVSREDGSGTRGAFVEIVGVVDENEDDMTTTSAVIQNGTNQVMSTVEGDANAIGYISLGSLNDSVKALNVDGAEATPEAIASGDYPIQRPFLVAYSGELSEAAADFMSFVHSAEGQTIVEAEGYIAVDASAEGEEEAPAEEEAATEEETTEEEAATEEETTEEAAEGEEAPAEEGAEGEEASEEETTEEEAPAEEETEEEAPAEEETEEEAPAEGEEEAPAEETETSSTIDNLPSYEATEGLEGTVETVGSTSVSPLMEILAEEYMALNPGVQVNVTSNGSSAGIEAAISGTADLGMSSRNLNEDEEGQVEAATIAIDGIAVIVNNENPLEDISMDDVRSIFLGEITTWEEVGQ